MKRKEFTTREKSRQNVCVCITYLHGYISRISKMSEAITAGMAKIITKITAVASCRALNFIAKLYETTQINILFQFLSIYTNQWQSPLMELSL